MMTNAALPGTDAHLRASINTSRIARVDIIREMADAEPHWHAFLKSGAIMTPYQGFAFVNTWQQTLGKDEGVSPFIVAVYDASQQPLLLLPLALGRENGARVARFMGGKHSTFNMGLWQRSFMESTTAAELETILSAIRAEGVDILALVQQPQNWRGILNPLSTLSPHPSVNPCPRMTLVAGAKPEERISTSTRRRLRNKEKKYLALPGYRYLEATTDAEINRLLDAFFIIKPQRMALSHLPDVFSDPATMSFVREACLAKLPNGDRAIKLHALECDDEMIAVFGCVADGERFSTIFNTYTISENARYSPGLILLRYMIDHFAESGYSSYDFGIGGDEYKRTFCKEDELLFDAFIPLTALGKLAALGMSSLNGAKRLVKQNPALMQMAQLLRNAIAR